MRGSEWTVARALVSLGMQVWRRARGAAGLAEGGGSDAWVGRFQGLVKGYVKGLSRACQGLCQGRVKGLSRASQGLVKGLSRACQGLCQGLCQGRVKGLSRASQGLVKGSVKGLSRACQALRPWARPCVHWHFSGIRMCARL